MNKFFLKSKKRRRMCLLRILAGLLLIPAMVLGLYSEGAYAYDSYEYIVTDNFRDDPSLAPYLKAMVDEAGSDQNSVPLAADLTTKSDDKTVVLQQTVSERDLALRKLNGFFPFLDTESYTPGRKPYWHTFTDYYYIPDEEYEYSTQTALERMGTSSDSDAVTTWFHVETAEDYKYMMSLAKEKEGVKILIGYDYSDDWSRFDSKHYISSGTETSEVFRRVGYTIGDKYPYYVPLWYSNIYKPTLAQYCYQFLGQTYMLDASLDLTYLLSVTWYQRKVLLEGLYSQTPEVMVTRTTPASFILHNDGDYCKLEIMDGTEGSGTYLSFDAHEDESIEPETYDPLSDFGYRFYPEVSEGTSGSDLLVDYNMDTEKVRFYSNIGKYDTISHFIRESDAWWEAEWTVKYIFNIEKEVSLSGKANYIFSRNIKMDFGTQYDYSTGATNFGYARKDLNYVACLAGGQLGWSMVGYVSEDCVDEDKDNRIWTTDATKAADTTAGVSVYKETKDGKPNFLSWEDITYENFGNYFFVYGGLQKGDFIDGQAGPFNYDLRMLPNRDYYATSFDVWFGLEGIPKSMLAEGADEDDGEEVLGKEKPTDYMAHTRVLSADLTLGVDQEELSFFTKANEILYVPADVTINIEENALFVVASNSVLLLHGRIVNRGNIIVQPGGVITYLDYEEGMSCAIDNIGGSMLVRDGGKVRLRILSGSTPEAITLLSIDAYRWKNGYPIQLVSDRVKAKYNEGPLGPYLKDLNNRSYQFKSTIENHGTILVENILALLEGTSVILDGGTLMFGRLRLSAYRQIFELTAEEWVDADQYASHYTGGGALDTSYGGYFPKYLVDRDGITTLNGGQFLEPIRGNSTYYEVKIKY